MPQPSRGRLKRLLIPAWNRAIHLARRGRMAVEAVARRQVGTCACCGRFGPFLLDRRVIPDRLVELWGLSRREAAAFGRKESLACLACGAKLRGRRLAGAIMELYPAEPAVRSLADWASRPEFRTLRVFEVNRIDGVHEAIAGMPLLGWSDYRDGAGPGSIVDGVASESLEGLTLADSSVDLLLTSETLEHVRNLDRALGEIRRALKPGGRHVFTVPERPESRRTYPRAVVGPGGAIISKHPLIHHPGGDSGYPVFHEIGADFADILADAGFEVEQLYGPPSLDDVAQVYVCRKPVAGGSS